MVEIRNGTKGPRAPAKKLRQGEGEIGLYLDVRKSNRDGFEGKVNTIRYRKPGGSFFAEDGLHVVTLEGSKARDGETLVLIKCHEPKTRDSIFVHFCIEMDRLRQELVKPQSTPEQTYPDPLGARAAQLEEEPVPTANAVVVANLRCH